MHARLPLLATLLLALTTATALAQALAADDKVVGAAVILDGPAENSPDGVIFATFRELNGSNLPARMYDVLGGKPKPQSVTHIAVSSWGLDAGALYSAALVESCAATPLKVWDARPPPASGQPQARDWTSFKSGALTARYGRITRRATNLRKVRVVDPTLDFAKLAKAAEEGLGVAVFKSGAGAGVLRQVGCAPLSVYDKDAVRGAGGVAATIVRNAKGDGEFLMHFKSLAEVPAGAAAVVQPLDPASGITPPQGGTPKTAVRFVGVARNFSPASPWQFHIHEKPVPADGNCTATGGHWDPLKASPRVRGGVQADYKPTPGNWATYELGDLSGKYGLIHPFANATAPSAANVQTLAAGEVTAKIAVDPTLEKVADFAALSMVVHDNSGARVGCANLHPGNYVMSLPTAARAEGLTAQGAEDGVTADALAANVNLDDADFAAAAPAGNAGKKTPGGDSGAGAAKVGAAALAVGAAAALLAL